MSSGLVRETPRHMHAYREYLRLGYQRSFEQLHKLLVEEWGEEIAPAANTLRSWSTAFGWQNRVVQDDQAINQRALERIRETAARDAERRRNTRLQLSDIQMNAAVKAMVRFNPESRQQEPRDLLKMDPSTLRAINDTIRLASETQRLDMGEATSRSGSEDADVTDRRVGLTDEGAIAEMQQFAGLTVEEDGAYDVIDAEFRSAAAPPEDPSDMLMLEAEDVSD